VFTEGLGGVHPPAEVLGMLNAYDKLERRICWPNPDSTCLEGGCIHCIDAPFRTFTEIRLYVSRQGSLPDRDLGRQKLAMVAWHDGLARNFHGADVRPTSTNVRST
jgi:hypothetical protein